MPSVFISYVSDNAEQVQQLAQELRAHGITVWLDRDKIMPGHRWADAIREGISQGDFFIACFSAEYHKRSKTYMNEELTLAIEELRQRPTDRAWFIPVLLSECEVPDRNIGAGQTLRSIQWVELYKNWSDGVRRILSIIPVPDQLPTRPIVEHSRYSQSGSTFPAKGGNLMFDFFDVYGERLDDKVDVFLKHQDLPGSRQAIGHNAKNALRVEDLISTPGGSYQLQVFPTRYRPVGRLFRVQEGKTARHAITLPVDIDRVTRLDFPAYNSLGEDLKHVLEASFVEGSEEVKGAELYGSLDDFRKAGLLNIYAKMKRTKFQNQRDIFSYLSSINRIRSERFFARVPKDLRDEVSDSIAARLFREASDALHTPPSGYSRAGSFKTTEQYCNLQLTFFNSNSDTQDYIVDADIDDARGIEHIFQVLSPIHTGMNTHPYNVHEILLGFQHIDPGYKLIV